MEIIGPSSKNKINLKRLFLCVGLTFIFIMNVIICYKYYVFKSIHVIAADSNKVSAGTTYNVKDLVKEVEGEIVSVKKDIDTSILGDQELILEVKKDNVTKEVPIVVSVIDSNAPVVEIKQEEITITQGDSIDLKENIQAVVDDYDGDLNFNDDNTQSKLMSYNISVDGDINSVGEHEVVVNAVDKSGNISTQMYKINVVEPELEPEPEPVYYQPVYYNYPASANGNDLVSIAYSYLGYPYGPGNYPGAFDCSGFVQFVYSQVGINISRSTYTQVYDGYPVSFDSMQPGDIIIWGYGSTPTHSAMYVGDGLMIHSANYGTGVIVNSVNEWLWGSGTGIVTIRRI
jgi:hypothetical protein